MIIIDLNKARNYFGVIDEVRQCDKDISCSLCRNFVTCKPCAIAQENDDYLDYSLIPYIHIDDCDMPF